MMLSSKASWVEVQAKRKDRTFDEYPDESRAMASASEAGSQELNAAQVQRFFYLILT